MSIKLIEPWGGKLVDLTVPQEAVSEALQRAKALPVVRLSERALCDLELLATGAFSPLDRFMGAEDYRRVVAEMRLANGYLFPIPITLPVGPDDPVRLDSEIALTDARNEIVATMTIEEVYQWDLAETAREVFGGNDDRHPLVAEMHRWGKQNISGRLQILRLPVHYDFRELRLTPAQTRERLAAGAFENIVAFQTRNPLHRAHEQMTKRAIEQVDGILLLHPVVGMTKPGDLDHFTRVRTYKALTEKYYAPDRILLSLLQLAMRLAGPREALWHALIRRNYGANHMIIGRDHASPGKDSQGNPFYGLYAAQELVKQFEAELGIKVVPFGEFVYLPEEDRYEDSRLLEEQVTTAQISGGQGRQWIREGNANLPSWFTRPEIAALIAEKHPPRHKQGFCVWFTGLSAAGKSTTAEILTALLQEHGRQVTVLDGDIVRTHLSSGLGFSKEDRDANIRRIGFVASEIVRHHGAVVCAAISPYRTTRNDVRNMIGTDHFIEVFVDTPLGECERRDTKGLYAKARKGDLPDFTGIDSPYEPPLDPELTLETVTASAEENAYRILDYLRTRGWVNTEDANGAKACLA
ncbi:MAG TPA: bifunctional sulfate adenylyltransferase/adenylylsulfate kinase [Pyrinomonadaceae bacterium]|jgi:sulfate adenylyltransferase|nr:bifunctional sulfate adenylyltransferase/adenylylsulfate kinase [Pyrinomonadaceae bacterium]